MLLLRYVYAAIVIVSALLSAWNAVHARRQRQEIEGVHRRLLLIEHWNRNWPRRANGPDEGTDGDLE